MATFLLVHGACTGGWIWEKVVPLLEANGHKVCAPDLPGLGKDHTPPANVTLADNVEKISRLLDKMDEPVVLAGHALGGEDGMKRCRKPEIMADAAYAIFNRPARTCTGNFFIDDEVLAAEGVTNFDQYAVSPGTPLMPDFFVPAPGARTVVGRS